MMRVLKTLHSSFSSEKKALQVLYTEGSDIHFNLAIEEYLFEQGKIETPTLFLWRNSPTIVIGKHQNPWKECKVEDMKRDSIKLSRRKTGGGAVYHDFGNTCFSFFTPYQKDEKLDYRSVNNQIIIDALKGLNIKAEISGRNDLISEGRKFSGSAYRLHLGNKDGVGRKSLHHGTVMFDVDLKALQKYLNPNKKKLESKGVDSVISRVINLKELYPTICHQVFCEEMEKSFMKYYGADTFEKKILNLEEMKGTEFVNTNFERLKSWDWLYGECPYFKQTIEKKFNWGLVEITFEVENGKIHKCKIYSDCLFPDFISGMTDKLIGIEYDGSGLERLSNNLKSEYKENEIFQLMSRDICEWIKSEI